MNNREELVYGVIILAAGESQRMGTPKPLVRLADKTLLEHILANPFLRRQNIHTVVVLGHAIENIKTILPPSVEHAENRNYMKGRTTSVQCGIRSLSDGIHGVFIWPVDCPIVPSEVLKRLAEALSGPEDICIPSYNFRRGHPCLIGASYFAEILSMSEDQPLRDLYHNHPDSIRHVEVDTETILHNLNTPDDVRKAERDFLQKRDGETNGK